MSPAAFLLAGGAAAFGAVGPPVGALPPPPLSEATNRFSPAAGASGNARAAPDAAEMPDAWLISRETRVLGEPSAACWPNQDNVIQCWDSFGFGGLPSHLRVRGGERLRLVLRPTSDPPDSAQLAVLDIQPWPRPGDAVPQVGTGGFDPSDGLLPPFPFGPDERRGLRVTLGWPDNRSLTLDYIALEEADGQLPLTGVRGPIRGAGGMLLLIALALLRMAASNRQSEARGGSRRHLRVKAPCRGKPDPRDQ